MIHEFMLRADKDVFENERAHYIVEISTNHYGCYKEIFDAVSDIIREYQDEENNIVEHKKYENE